MALYRDTCPHHDSGLLHAATCVFMESLGYAWGYGELKRHPLLKPRKPWSELDGVWLRDGTYLLVEEKSAREAGMHNRPNTSWWQYDHNPLDGQRDHIRERYVQQTGPREQAEACALHKWMLILAQLRHAILSHVPAGHVVYRPVVVFPETEQGAFCHSFARYHADPFLNKVGIGGELAPKCLGTFCYADRDGNNVPMCAMEIPADNYFGFGPA
jgi:hypothetical protein